ncbi:MAG: single-stranded DNA-binding protein [Prolixibacteraceae bacterium]|nr:single-stranded DNA-binding protein [Prolixibacteraceae bacterium]
MSVNKVILIGNVGKDPVVRHLDKDVTVANFTLATSESYVKDGNKVTNTEWHNIVVWRGLATVVEKYVKKGDKLYLEGRIKTRSWEDKDQNKRYTTEIYVDNLEMLGSPNRNAQSSSSNTTNTSDVNEPQTTEQGNDNEDDLPF